MSALDDLSELAKRALWVSCMASNVPVQVTDPHTIERVAALLRSGPETKQSRSVKKPSRTAPCDESGRGTTHIGMPAKANPNGQRGEGRYDRS